MMAAGVNFNNVWAALRRARSVFRYHPRSDHHIGGSDASGIVWKIGAGVTQWKPGDEVVIHCNQASYEDSSATASTRSPLRRRRSGATRRAGARSPSSRKVQAQQLLPKPKNLTWEEAASYGLDLLHRLPDADRPVRAAGRRTRS